MKRRKILYIITKSNFGGAQRYVYDLSTQMSADFEVVVAFGGAGGKGASEGTLSDMLRGAHVRTLVIKSFMRDISLWREVKSFFELISLLRKEKPDVLHLNSSKAGGLGALAGRVTGAPHIVFTVHGWPFKEGLSFTIKFLRYIATWITVLFSHTTIVISKQDEKLGKHMWLVREKIKYIPIGLNASEILQRDVAEKRLSFGSSGNTAYNSKHRLVTIAELTKNKGLKYTIDMMEELKKRHPRGVYTYTIFGEGEDATSLLNYARAQGVAESVYFENMASNRPQNLSTEASTYLKAFDIFVLPSIKEGMPYVLLEAAAAGLPIIATDILEQEAKDIPNIYFVTPRDGQALADAVEKLAQSKQKKTPDTIRSFEVMLGETRKLYSLNS